MKPWTAAITGFVIGVAIALSGAQAFWMRTLRAASLSALHSMEEKQEIKCMVSLVAVDKLEKGEQDHAKSFLAREVASYYHHPLGPSDAPQRKKILPYIEAVRAKSSALNEELSKKAQ